MAVRHKQFVTGRLFAAYQSVLNDLKTGAWSSEREVKNLPDKLPLQISQDNLECHARRQWIIAGPPTARDKSWLKDVYGHASPSRGQAGLTIANLYIHLESRCKPRKRLGDEPTRVHECLNTIFERGAPVAGELQSAVHMHCLVCSSLLQVVALGHCDAVTDVAPPPG